MGKWSKFGILTRENDEDARHYFIYNEEDDSRKFSKGKYPAARLAQVKADFAKLKGQPVEIWTDQDDSEQWRETVWFSKIRRDESG